MSDLPALLTSGERARLIPVVADTSREGRAASVLLSTLMSVKNFAKSLLETVGQRVGVQSDLECYTETVFKKSPPDLRGRPDGLVILRLRKNSWSALIEVKIGNAELDEGQIVKYCQLAKLNGVDALITISNQFAALPTHHPIRPSKSLTRSVDLYHWSWMYLLTQATLLLLEEEFESPEQRYLLSEMVRYFKHDRVGISTFDQMNREWKDLVLKVQSGAPLHRSAPEVENTVAAWHQEQRDLGLLMSRRLGRYVSLKLSRTYDQDPEQRLREDSERLVRQQNLDCVLDVPDAAAPITVCADIRRRTVTCGMRLEAPKNKKSSKPRIRWLVRQLSKSDPDGIFIKAVWPGRTNDTQARLAAVRDDPAILTVNNKSAVPHHFEVIMVRDLAGKFSGSRTFIEHLEATVPDFYERVGQYLQAWVPPPPKIAKPPVAPSEQSKPEKAESESEQPNPEAKKRRPKPQSFLERPRAWEL